MGGVARLDCNGYTAVRRVGEHEREKPLNTSKKRLLRGLLDQAVEVTHLVPRPKTSQCFVYRLRRLLRLLRLALHSHNVLTGCWVGTRARC